MIRKDLHKFIIQPNLYFLVFHKVFNGFGSAVSLYINNYEFLKFDCFGIKKGHYHIYDDKINNTIFFTETTPVEQINKTCFELSNNLNYYLEKSNRLDIKNFKVDFEQINLIIDNIKNKMLEFEQTFYASLR